MLYILYEHCWREPENKNLIAKDSFTVIVGHMTINLKVRISPYTFHNVLLHAHLDLYTYSAS